MYAVLYGGQKIGRIGRIDRIGKALIGWQDLKNWKDLQDWQDNFPTWEGGGDLTNHTAWRQFTKLFLAGQNNSEVLEHVLKKGRGHIFEY